MVTHDPRYSVIADRTIHLLNGHVADQVMNPCGALGN
jgi:ABC-type lipoprotein export system ATPase subunit